MVSLLVLPYAASSLSSTCLPTVSGVDHEMTVRVLPPCAAAAGAAVATAGAVVAAAAAAGADVAAVDGAAVLADAGADGGVAAPPQAARRLTPTPTTMSERTLLRAILEPESWIIEDLLEYKPLEGDM